MPVDRSTAGVRGYPGAAPCAPACSPPRVAALLLPAAPAVAGDPIMPLSDVRAGMQCTALLGGARDGDPSFDAEVLDVVDGDPETDEPADPRPGVRPGGGRHRRRARVLGLADLLPRRRPARARNIGAISETIGQYGGKVVLATPIESILGTPPDAPAPRGGDGAAARRQSAGRALAGARGGRPLAAPRSPSAALTAPARPRARVRAAGGAPGARCSPPPPGRSGRFPPQPPRPGSAVAVGYSSGDIRLGAVGTVAYTDEDRVWAFGHPFEAVGRRALLLQDAYVYQVIDNPLQLGEFGSTYKLAAPGHDLGTFSNDAHSAVAGRTGPLPSTVPVRVFAIDLDTGEQRVTGLRVADETAVDTPGGRLAAGLRRTARRHRRRRRRPAQRARPADRRRCARRSRCASVERPLRFCNRYVSATPADAGLQRHRQRRRRPRGVRRLRGPGDDRRLQGPPAARHRGRRADRHPARPAPGLPALRRLPRGVRAGQDVPRAGDAPARCAGGGSPAPTACGMPSDLRAGAAA